jgi:hypothetical protein
MRLFRYAILGLLASMLTLSAAQADTSTSRIFGTTSCPQKFSCTGTEEMDLATMANDCAVRGLGIGTVQTGIFDNASLDSNNCMTGKLPSTGGEASMAPKCCIVAEQDTCSMHCQLLVY